MIWLVIFGKVYIKASHMSRLSSVTGLSWQTMLLQELCAVTLFTAATLLLTDVITHTIFWALPVPWVPSTILLTPHFSKFSPRSRSCCTCSQLCTSSGCINLCLSKMIDYVTPKSSLFCPIALSFWTKFLRPSPFCCSAFPPFFSQDPPLGWTPSPGLNCVVWNLQRILFMVSAAKPLILGLSGPVLLRLLGRSCMHFSVQSISHFYMRV